MKRTLQIALLLLALPARSAESVAPASPAGSLIQMVLGLTITLALLIGGLYILKRLQGSRGTSPGALRILDATAVGTREKVILLSVGNKVLVLGVSPGRISTLHTMDPEELPSAPPPRAAQIANDFAGRLRQFMERRNEN